MTRFTLPIASLATLLVSAFAATPAQTQTRVFVAAQGSDSNPCTFAAPCRSFQHAHDVVAAKGEIDVLDPAGYGTLTITKAISIQGHDFSGMTVGSGSNGVSINAGPGDLVKLRGLIIEGSGVGSSGIYVSRVGSLIIENSVISGFQYNGVAFFPSTDASTYTNASQTSLVMTNTVVSNVFNNGGGYGIGVSPTGSGSVRATLHRVTVSNSYYGIWVSGMNNTASNLIAAVTDSVVTGCQGGITAMSFAVHTSIVHVMVTGTVLSGNGTALAADGSAGGLSYLRVGRSTISGNAYPSLPQGNAHILSAGDNYSDDGVTYPESFAKN